MAGVSTKEIKNRIRSMESTRQITKAMEMVAASKLRHCQAQVQNSRPYFEILRSTIEDIIRTNRDFSSPFFASRSEGKTVFIVIAGDRGLAGGYNSNVLKLVQAKIDSCPEALVLPIGKRALDYCVGHRIPVLTETYAEAAGVSIGDCFSIAKQLSRGFLNGEYNGIQIAYTNFVSMLSQTPDTMQLLPLTCDEAMRKNGAESGILYEPSGEEVFASIVPEYLAGLIYGAVCESVASELAARRTAMEAATNNAEEMIEKLNLHYNRARQASITQEITEIVGGAEGI